MTNPVLKLVLRQMEAKGITRRILAEAQAEGKNRPKAFRRLDQLLSGESLVPELVRRVACVLQIPADAVAAAWEEHHRLEKERAEEEIRGFYEDALARRGPHLWVQLPVGYRPPLVTFLGTERYLLVKLPLGIADLPDERQVEEVGEVARNHYRDPERRLPSKISGYEYRRSLEEAFRFNVEGGYLGRVEGRWSEPRVGVAFEKDRVDTSAGLFGRSG